MCPQRRAAVLTVVTTICGIWIRSVNFRWDSKLSLSAWITMVQLPDDIAEYGTSL